MSFSFQGNVKTRAVICCNNVFLFTVAPAVSEIPPIVSTPPASVGVTPVAVVSVPTVTATVTAGQTVPLLPRSLPPGLPHAVAQPATAIPAFPPVMVPPFRVPLPGMHIPLPGKAKYHSQATCLVCELFVQLSYSFTTSCMLRVNRAIGILLCFSWTLDYVTEQ